MKRIWDDYLTEQDKEVFKLSGYGVEAGFGSRPVLLIIDMNYNFLGDSPKPILESINEWPNSCGLVGWKSVPVIQNLINICRNKRIPIIYTTGEVRGDKWDRGSWAWKNNRTSKKSEVKKNFDSNDIISELKPHSTDIVIKKIKPSGFYGTNLQSFLNLLKVDTLILTGTTTSGCVRATAIDGFSANYKVSVVEDCCFDRSQSSHAINLCDLNSKYADVISCERVINYLEKLKNDLFELPIGDRV